MADEKDLHLASATAPVYDNGHDDTTDSISLPQGWRYKQLKIGSLKLPWYASPKFQLFMVAIVCFMCPGMFNALGGMGGGGKADAKVADDMNVALYSTFAVFGYFGGVFVNWLGVRLCLAFGGSGYALYAIALLVSEHSTRVGAFNIVAGAILGVCAGLLWTAQGTIMISYPQENQKGRYFAWFWAIFNLGGVIGSLIPLGQNFHVKDSSKTVGDGTYIAFIVLMAFGCFLAFFLVDAKAVIRKDGSRVVLMKNPTFKSEMIGLWETLQYSPWVLLLFPMFWASNWFYTYQPNAVNGARHSTRTKALNSCLYWLAQIIGALFLGYLLDIEKVSRSMRAKIVWAFLVIMTMVIWGGGYALAKTYDRDTVDVKKNPSWKPIDWQDSNYIGGMFLYIFYGFYDSLWQASVYWFMGALSNSGRRSANFVGFYKGIQSAGAAVMWSLDSRKISFMSEFASNWGLLMGALVIAAPVIFLKIKDHVPVEEDLKNTDETLADVLPAGHAEKPGTV